MASPTTNKGYTYAAHGGSVGSWDTQLNGNIEAQDLNLGGYYSITASSSITVANTFNSTYATIASTAQSITLASSIAQNLFYNIKGTLASSLAVNMPAVGSIYTFGSNLTTGSSYAIAVQPTGGSAVTLASGGQTTAVLTSTGANYAQNAFTSLTVSSALTAGGPLTQNSSQYEQLASGDTAARPAATAAYFRYNTTLGQPEWSDGVTWYPVGAQSVAAGFKNLKVTNNAVTPNTKIDVTADAVTVETTAGTAYRLLTVSLTIDCTVNGANGLDAGGLANSTWYSVWVIYNPATGTTAGLASLSATAPTMPAGYTAKARYGWFRTTAAAIFNRILQYGRSAQYVVSAATTTAFPQMASANTASVITAIAVGAYVPTTASRIRAKINAAMTNNLLMQIYANSLAASLVYSAQPGNTASLTEHAPVEILLESTNIYYASSLTATVSCVGWEDNI